jgi:2-polyprenyl-3-methyl-5-hydroxy-6-metoxy-1,4-benzoquinol methylase
MVDVRREPTCRRRVHPAFLEACGDVRGLNALDVGCGEGWCARELARRGATVVGVDASEARITRARALQAAGGEFVDYRVMDAVHIDRGAWGRTFDLAVACMSLQEMAEPGTALHATRRVLKGRARLVCSMTHPFADTVDYFATRTVPVRRRSGTGPDCGTVRWHRSLAEYWQLVTSAGFVVRDLLERAEPGAAGAAPTLLILVAEADPARPSGPAG